MKLLAYLFMPPIEWSGAYCFCPVCLSVCLFVCLSVVNFNIRYNFWTVRGRDFIFGMHTPLMMPFQMTPRSMTCDLDFDLCSKNSFFGLCCRRGHSQCFTNTPWFLNIQRNYIKLIQSTKLPFPYFATMFEWRSRQGHMWLHHLMTSCSSDTARKMAEIFLSKQRTMTNIHVSFSEFCF